MTNKFKANHKRMIYNECNDYITINEWIYYCLHCKYIITILHIITCTLRLIVVWKTLNITGVHKQ